MLRRLDEEMTARGIVQSRSQAANLVKLGKVKVGGQIVSKPGKNVLGGVEITVIGDEMYVSRAAFKLASAAKKLGVDFRGKTVLDVGSSTGGFTDYALQNGAKRIVAVDVGTDQLHPTLRSDERIELHEKTDIRSFSTTEQIDLVVIDVSFISLREVLPAVAALSSDKTEIVAMVKPQFEAGANRLNKGIVKNDSMRRTIMKDFEAWARNLFVIGDKADSDVSGKKGNVERFYLLKPLKR